MDKVHDSVGKKEVEKWSYADLKNFLSQLPLKYILTFATFQIFLITTILAFLKGCEDSSSMAAESSFVEARIPDHRDSTLAGSYTEVKSDVTVNFGNFRVSTLNSDLNIIETKSGKLFATETSINDIFYQDGDVSIYVGTYASKWTFMAFRRNRDGSIDMNGQKSTRLSFDRLSFPDCYSTPERERELRKFKVFIISNYNNGESQIKRLSPVMIMRSVTFPGTIDPILDSFRVETPTQ